MNRKALLLCGIAASSLYLVLNIIASLMYRGYSAASQTVSELSAIGAPTRDLWVPIGIIYSLLMICFGFGIRRSAITNRNLRIVGLLFIINAVVSLFWPPMHQREVLAAGGGTISDTLHIVFTIITVPLMMLLIAFGSSAFGRNFKIYSTITFVVLIVFGILTGIDGPKIQSNLPTPFIGIWERINIGSYMIWVAVLSVMMTRRLMPMTQRNFSEHRRRA